MEWNSRKARAIRRSVGVYYPSRQYRPRIELKFCHRCKSIEHCIERSNLFFRCTECLALVPKDQDDLQLFLQTR